MAFLTIMRTAEDRCEQCDATENVLQFVVSQTEEDNIRLTACVICTVVAMDNAMEWHMSRQFAQALANRAAGEQVQAEAKRQKDSYDRRVRETEDRARTRIPVDGGTGRNTTVLPLGIADAGSSAKLAQATGRSDRASRSKGTHRKT